MRSVASLVGLPGRVGGVVHAVGSPDCHPVRLSAWCCLVGWLCGGCPAPGRLVRACVVRVGRLGGVVV